MEYENHYASKALGGTGNSKSLLHAGKHCNTYGPY